MHADRVVGVELLLDGGRGGGGAGDGDAVLDGRALLGRKPLEERGADIAGELLKLLWGGGIAVDVALAHAHHAGVEGDVKARAAPRADDELGRAAADIDDHGGLRCGGPTGHGAEEGELSLFLPLKYTGIKAIVLTHMCGEVGAI